ncbi:MULTISPECIES: 50S ribosomal protein L11 methyltransferase [unclassified Devosia]|uniref:class I SAM-dependent methyltransferase n=1 Tax=unclassified Devosia TaxID=196773 RepID=UPI0023D7C5B2|nr:MULTISPECIES: 50S ribosomal protein L11 methyltransferase [unclassified Devosia]WEJ33686.1 50S ribosomal protein L11 methyltransferase [Devosia sp. SD17-2]
MSLSPEEFIRQRLTLAPLPFRPDILLHRATPQSRLTEWLAEQDRADTAPYWAYAWAGGAALALYLADHPETVAGRTVLDIGAGSGLVGIAAAKARAVVRSFEPDLIGKTACRLNAEANAVTLTLVDDPLTPADIVLAGDVFYDAAVAASTLPLLQQHRARGAEVFVGDPYRRDLPLAALNLLAEYYVPDMGSSTPQRAGVFALHPRAIGPLAPHSGVPYIH